MVLRVIATDRTMVEDRGFQLGISLIFEGVVLLSEVRWRSWTSLFNFISSTRVLLMDAVLNEPSKSCCCGWLG
jgi:hypothetical protein